MSSKPSEQLAILKDIFQEDFEAVEAGTRQYAVLYKLQSVDGVEIPAGITILIDFEDRAKVRMLNVPLTDGGYSKEEDDLRFMGNLNVFVMRGKKVLNALHKPFSGPEFERRHNTYSFRQILDTTKF